MVWRRHTWQMCSRRSRLSSSGGTCGRQTAGHSSCRAQGPRSVGGTLPWLARPLGTASPSTCGFHHCLEIHLRKNSNLIYLVASAPEVFCNWALYKLTYSFIHLFKLYCLVTEVVTQGCYLVVDRARVEPVGTSWLLVWRATVRLLQRNNTVWNIIVIKNANALWHHEQRLWEQLQVKSTSICKKRHTRED